MSTQITQTASVRSQLPHNSDIKANPLHPRSLNTYRQLLQKYEEINQFSQDGLARSKQVFKNIRSVTKNWTEFFDLTLDSPIGDELGMLFDKCLVKYLNALADSGITLQTQRDRKSFLRSLHAIYYETVLSDGLPSNPTDALDCLIRVAGLSDLKLSRKSGVKYSLIQQWRREGFKPLPSSLEKIHELEKALIVSRGTIASRFPSAYWLKVKRYQSGRTIWRNNQTKIIKLQYRIKEFPSRLKEEWEALYRFFTDPEWVEEQGLSNNFIWTVRPNGTCGTANVKERIMLSFFGYISLPKNNDNAELRGAGLSEEAFTLALFSDFELVRRYLNFLKQRNAMQSFNRGTYLVISFCTQLLRPETGYLWQLPEFSERMPEPIAQANWHEWCRDNRAKFVSFLKRITKNRRNNLRPTRDSFEPIRGIIENLQHPITVLLDLARTLESLTPTLKNCLPVSRAVHARDIFTIKLLASNPLRVENLSMMTYLPRDRVYLNSICEAYGKLPSSILKADPARFYVETVRSSNLYQKPDGSWWIRFNPNDFKSFKPRPLQIPYDVPVVKWVWPALMDYLFRHRSVLCLNLKNNINKMRKNYGFAPLSSEDEMAVDLCPFVFRPAYLTLTKSTISKLNTNKGCERIANALFTNRLLNLTQRYIPGCPGFGAHACRHLVASEYIKNHPDGWAVAAAALHDSIDIVRNHYAWIRAADTIRPWNDYLEKLCQDQKDEEDKVN